MTVKLGEYKVKPAKRKATEIRTMASWLEQLERVILGKTADCGQKNRKKRKAENQFEALFLERSDEDSEYPN